MAYFLAFMVFSVLRLRRGLILKNLDIVFGSARTLSQKKRIGLLSIYHFILTSLELLASQDGMLSKKCEFVDMVHLKEALAKGKGVYLLCIHMGSWEAMGSALTKSIAPTHVVVKKVGGKALNQVVTELRIKNGFLPILRKKKGDAFKGIKKALLNNEVVGFAFDQARPGEPKLPFFGKLAKTNTSLAAIQMRFDAPIIPAYTFRVTPQKHKICFLPEVDLVEGDGMEDTILKRSAQFNKIVEAMILNEPSQYFWMHNRWKE